MKRKTNFILPAILVTMFLITSCATLFAPKTHPLTVSSEPQDAEIYVNGLKMGTTPVELSLKADKSYTIEFRKEGYKTVTEIVNTKIGAGWLVLDVLTGFVPVIIDAATGAWNKLDQEAVNAALVKQNE